MTDRLYLRISLDTAASGSISKQREQTRRFASADAVEYVDESVSGSKIPFAERPAGSRLLRDLQRGDRVLVSKIDRAARNVRDLLSLVERIREAGASIVFTEQNISTEGPMGMFMLTLLGAVAELEAAMIAERRRESLFYFRQEGRHAVGSAPYGLQSVPNPDGRGRVLRPHPEEAPRLREAIERILSGEWSQNRAAEFLGLSATGFSRLLRNDRLIGVLGHGDDGPRVDPEQAVFSFVEWDRLQRFLADRPEKTWRRSDDFGPVLACAVCGERLYFQTSKRNPDYATYRCRAVNHGPGDRGVSIMARNAERVIEEDFMARLGRVEAVKEEVTSGSAARVEAIAVARLRMDAAKRAQDEAEDEEAEERAFMAYRAAKRALREAEAMPDEVVTVEVPLGKTYGQIWQESSVADRINLLQGKAVWVVEPGRLPLDKKIRFERLGADVSEMVAADD